jgi:hypothetical protein
MKPSGRSQVEPFRVMEVLAAANLRARSGQSVYHSGSRATLHSGAGAGT